MRESIFGNSEPLIDFNIITKDIQTERHFSEVRGKLIKQSATREELMQVSDRVFKKKM